ncbi:MAG: Kdo hydroxylase family protein [Thermoanaerobaculia bacterium]
MISIRNPSTLDPVRRARCQRALELGGILFFPESPIAVSSEDRKFLLTLDASDSSFHKNIAYRPGENRLTGFSSKHPATAERLKEVLSRYSEGSRRFLSEIFPSYGGAERDYASFRPIEEAGRPLALRSRNDLLHVDSFPTRPTRGGRILRVFANLNDREPRRWITGRERFGALAARYAASSGILGRSGWRQLLLRRPRYDDFMLRFHHFLKENQEYQAACPKVETSFPPGSGWMVFTDTVAHAVLSGRFALEQTFIVPRSRLAVPERAPISVLERMSGRAREA